jgi:hypothetical protein
MTPSGERTYRERATERYRRSGADERGENLSSERLIEELRIHQIELEFQNEQLMHARNEAEQARAESAAQLLGVERRMLLSRSFNWLCHSSDAAGAIGAVERPGPAEGAGDSHEVRRTIQGAHVTVQEHRRRARGCARLLSRDSRDR